MPDILQNAQQPQQTNPPQPDVPASPPPVPPPAIPVPQNTPATQSVPPVPPPDPVKPVSELPKQTPPMAPLPPADVPEKENPFVGMVTETISTTETATNPAPASVKNSKEPTEAPKNPPASSKPAKKRLPIGVLLTTFLVLAVTIPLSVFYLSQQRNIADIRSKAAAIDCVGEGGKCYPTNYICSDTITIPTNCPSGKKCTFGTCTAPTPTPPPTPTPTPAGGLKNDWESCRTGSECKSGICGRDPGDNTMVCLPGSTPTPTPAPQDYCDRSSPNTADCTDKSEGSPCTRRENYGGGKGTCRIINPGGANSECECAVAGTPKPTPTPTPPPCQSGYQCQGIANQNECVLNRKGKWQECSGASGTTGRGNCCVPKTQPTPTPTPQGGTPTPTPQGGTPTPTPLPTPIKDCTFDCQLGDTDKECIPNPVCPQGQLACRDTGCPTPPTPTDEPIAVCKDIKIYKDGKVVNPKTLEAGDNIVIAVVGEKATKARIKVNNGKFTETKKKNKKGEFILSYTIPADVVKFSIQAEVFRNGKWK